MTENQINSSLSILAYFRKYMPQDLAIWLTAMVLHETNGLRSKISKVDNNFSGITWINKPYQVNATKGTQKPKSEGGYYARFKSQEDWARDFLRILAIGGTSAPLYSTSVEQFVKRLKRNNYFTDSEENYKKAVKRWVKKMGEWYPKNGDVIITPDGNTQKQQGYNIDNPADRNKNPFEEIEDYWNTSKYMKPIVYGFLGLFALKTISDIFNE